MPRDVLHKSPEVLRAPHNLTEYSRACAGFNWAKARASLLSGLPGGGLNIAHEAVDRHAAGPNAERIALRCLARGQPAREFTYRQLRESSNRFADVLRGLGVLRDERVFALSERVPELYFAALGTFKYGAVFCPLFPAFGPEPIHTRLTLGDARVLVTTPLLYRRKIAGLRDRLPGLKHVLLITDGQAPGDDLPAAPGVHHLNALLDAASAGSRTAPTKPDDVALLHFTSGTTGQPKGVLHVHEAVLVHAASARFALDLQDGDRFWCTADPGWVTGTSYGIIAPLVLGVTLIVDREEFDAERWYGILRDERVTVWYTAPTAIRILMKYGTGLARRQAFPDLRYMASVGEPLNPEAVVWGQEAFGLPFHDNWWQTETGGIMIANYAAMDIKPGSMGRPLPGIEAVIVRREADGSVMVQDEPGAEGELALRAGWPSMFRGYLNDHERYRRCFADGWYLSGDLARCDRDGYFWFMGRADDVIKTSGHRVGPFEIESVLLEHPAAAEVGVIGKPDPVAGEIIKAFVELKPGYTGDEALRRELLGFARQRLGATLAPKEIAFAERLPRTRSGKILRRLLKARELGLPEGDLSTLEPAA